VAPNWRSVEMVGQNGSRTAEASAAWRSANPGDCRGSLRLWLLRDDRDTPHLRRERFDLHRRNGAWRTRLTAFVEAFMKANMLS
jgi:hypothetical protein